MPGTMSIPTPPRDAELICYCSQALKPWGFTAKLQLLPNILISVWNCSDLRSLHGRLLSRQLRSLPLKGRINYSWKGLGWTPFSGQASLGFQDTLKPQDSVAKICSSRICMHEGSGVSVVSLLMTGNRWGPSLTAIILVAPGQQSTKN